MNEDKFPLKKSKSDRAWIILIMVLIVLILFVLGLKLFVLARIEIEMSSMENTLSDGDKIWVNRLKAPKENDIVVFERNGDYLIKRVVAVSGDSIKIQDGLLYIKRAGENDYSLKNEDYIKEPMNTNKDMSETLISEDCIFVMGDNRNVSYDSRDFGEVSTKDCIGIKI